MNTIEAVSFLLESNSKFRVKVQDFELISVLKQFNVYNDIPNNLNEIVDYTYQLIGATNFGGDNPNNGKFDNIEFEIGNEGSLVIYITVKPSYRIHSNRDHIKNNLHLIGAEFEANENTLAEDGYFLKQRIWWD